MRSRSSNLDYEFAGYYVDKTEYKEKSYKFCGVKNALKVGKIQKIINKPFHFEYTSMLNYEYYLAFMENPFYFFSRMYVYIDELTIECEDTLHRIPIRYTEKEEYVKAIERICSFCDLDSVQCYLEQIREELIKQPSPFCYCFEEQRKNNNEMFVRCIGL